MTPRALGKAWLVEIEKKRCHWAERIEAAGQGRENLFARLLEEPQQDLLDLLAFCVSAFGQHHEQARKRTVARGFTPHARRESGHDGLLAAYRRKLPLACQQGPDY